MKSTTLLQLKHVSASLQSGKTILCDISMMCVPGKIHVIMGPNGSGKSTLAKVIMGNSEYKMKGKILLGQVDIAKETTEERAKRGMFLAFQSPIAISGVSVMNLLRTAHQEIRAKKQKSTVHQKTATGTISEFLETIKKYAKLLHIDDSLLTRSIHEGFSGGEKKKIEVLQALVLEPKFAIFDEIDTGLDVDALQIVARGIELLGKRGTGCIIITHYQRLLSYLSVDGVTVMKQGSIVKTGGGKLVSDIDKKGYANV